MMHVKIPIETTQEMIIGDIWVNVDIKFMPMMPPRGVSEDVVITGFNARMNIIAAELKSEIQDKLRKIFSEQQSSEELKGSTTGEKHD